MMKLKLSGQLSDPYFDSAVFIVDIRNEYHEIPAISSYALFLKWVVRYGSQVLRRGNRVQIRLCFGKKIDLVNLFQLFQGIKNCTLVVDEADALFSYREFAKPMIDMFLGARNNNLTLFFMGKRPFLIPIVVRSQADIFYIFQTEEKSDIDYLGKRLRTEFPIDPFDLSKGQCIYAEPGEKPEIMQFPKYQPAETAAVVGG